MKNSVFTFDVSAVRSLFAIAVIGCLALANSSVQGQNRVADLCTIKGQERNILRGVGLVVGLQGTGDPNLATTGAAIAEMLSKSGWEIPRDASGQAITEIYKDDKNAALVFVTAEVPASGARQGTVIRCQVSSWGRVSSLEGGMLLETALTGGPAITAGQNRVGISATGELPILGIASGPIRLEGTLTSGGIVDQGAQLTVDFNHRFYEEVAETVPSDDVFGGIAGTQRMVRFLNLIVKPGHADFGTTDRVAQQINDELVRQAAGGPGADAAAYARATDSVNIRVRFPSAYLDDPVGFARYILEEIPVVLNTKHTKIVMNRKTGVITVGEDVFFSPVAITSGDFKVDIAPFRELSLDDAAGLGAVVKLKRLTQALNDLQAPPATIIDIIKHLEAGGHLYGEIIEQ